MQVALIKSIVCERSWTGYVAFGIVASALFIEAESNKQGPWLRPLPHLTCAHCENLLHVDRLAVRIQRALNADLLPFVFLQFFLPVDVIALAAGILQNILVA